MNWAFLRPAPWLDTRARFVAGTPRNGTLLDLGASDGETLNHIHELRPDLKLFASDKYGAPEKYPQGTVFEQIDFEQQPLPWADASMDSITCMHLVEHLSDLKPLMREIARLLKPGGRAYFETPHPKTLHLPSLKGRFTMNFFDDATHVRVVTTDELHALAASEGLVISAAGISRNWLFAMAHPLFLLLPDSRKKHTARIHWLGWSACLLATRPR